TLRADLPELISGIRAIGHIPLLLTNGIKLTNAEYVKELKEAGLRTVYLSLNGGLKDELYERTDGVRCAPEKLLALHNLCKDKFVISAGMILMRDLNVSHLKEFASYLDGLREVREIKLRSVGRFGIYTDSDPLTMEELIEVCHKGLGVSLADIRRGRRRENLYYFQSKGKRVQITRWPDLGNPGRGYLTREGTIEPFFEYLVASEKKGESPATAPARKAVSNVTY
ncbi:MAG: radical SAM protein, partial [Thermodesulfobacteriota bacterium]